MMKGRKVKDKEVKTNTCLLVSNSHTFLLRQNNPGPSTTTSASINIEDEFAHAEEDEASSDDSIRF